MSAYFGMGGYAVFIWPSYLLAIVLLIAIFMLATRRLEAATQALDDLGDEAGEDTDSAP